MGTHYFDLLKPRSVRLQIKWWHPQGYYEFQADPNIANPARFVATDGNLDRYGPDTFLAGDERAAVLVQPLPSAHQSGMS